MMTLTANSVSVGLPVSGSIICPAESCASKETAVCSDVDTLSSLSMTCGSILFEGSLKCTSQAVWPGRRPHRENRASPGVDQSIADSQGAQDFSGPVHGVALCQWRPSPTANRMSEN